MKVALVGNGRTTKDSEGFDGEIWSTASVSKILPRVDRIFEVHKTYDMDRLNGYECPIMTDGYKANLYNSIDLKIDDMVERFGPVFQFSFDYMMAKVIEDGAEEIHLFGIDLTTDTEYEQFRQSFYYWVGYARGVGIKVVISPGSLIFNRDWVYCHKPDAISELVGMYGDAADKKIDEWEKKQDEARLGVAFSQGYLQCVEDIKRMGVIG